MVDCELVGAVMCRCGGFFSCEICLAGFGGGSRAAMYPTMASSSNETNTKPEQPNIQTSGNIWAIYCLTRHWTTNRKYVRICSSNWYIQYPPKPRLLEREIVKTMCIRRNAKWDSHFSHIHRRSIMYYYLGRHGYSDTFNMVAGVHFIRKHETHR